MIKIASAHLWVHDQEVALKFWTDKVGMEVRDDVSFPEEMGAFRWLTVGPPGQDDVNVVLMAVPGEPLMDDATRKQVLDLTANFPRRRIHGAAEPDAVRHRLWFPRSVGQ